MANSRMHMSSACVALSVRHCFWRFIRLSAGYIIFVFLLGLSLRDRRPQWRVLCSCDDCIAHGRWAAAKGGPQSPHILDFIFFSADITIVVGAEYLEAVRLRENYKSTRLVCTKCLSTVIVDHPSYMDSAAMVSRDLCKLDADERDTITLHFGSAYYDGPEGGVEAKQRELCGDGPAYPIVPSAANWPAQLEMHGFPQLPPMPRAGESLSELIARVPMRYLYDDE